VSRLLLLPVLIALGGGSPVDASSSVDSQPSQTNWRIDEIPLLKIGDDPEEALHEVIGAVITDEALILAEASTYSLRFHDRATGKFLRAVGRQGEGPGEYERLDLLQSVGDKLFTFDGWLRRVTVRDRAGDVERTVPIRPWGDYNSLDLEGFFSDGSILVSAWAFGWVERPTIRRFNRELARLGPGGTFADRIGAYQGDEHYASPETMSIYPYRRQVWVVVVGDKYHIVDNKHPAIRVFDRSGNVVAELQPYAPLEPRKLTSAARDSLPDMDGVEGDDLPRFYPYYGRPLAVGGTLWVPDYDGLAPGGGSAWTVYSQGGDLVGRVTASELDIIPLDADSESVVVLARNAFDVQTVELRRMIEHP